MRSNFAKLAVAGFVMLFALTLKAQHSSKRYWTINAPFEHNVFIENKGQFIEQVEQAVGQKILYYSHKGHLHLYFTPTTLTFEYDSAYRTDNDAKAGSDEDAGIKILPVFMNITWDGANPNAMVEVQNPVSDYFTYRDPKDNTGRSSIMANAWKKIIYHNLYNNIDVAFYYSADGKGLEYDIIVHPGGDPSSVKMHYSNNAHLSLLRKEIKILSPCARLTDRAPVAWDESGNPVAASFSVTNNVVSFTAGNYDKTKTLVIDPLLSTTSFTGTNKAYDLQYDLKGNVYVMGGGDATEFQLQKYNSAGTLQWTYTSTFTYKFKGYYYYGGFTTDNRSGSSFVAEGLDYSGSGCIVVKINAAGAVAVTFPGSTNVNEIWRIAYDYCDNQLIIGAGEGSSAVYQGATMDTNCTTVNAVNVLGAGAGSTHHDMAMITFDGVGKCYMATTKPASSSYTGYDNVLLQMPAATLAPTAYQVYDRSVFIETASIPYYPALPSSPYLYCGNGFNGLIADLNLVVTYDGNKLRKWTPATGAIVDSATVTPQVQLWGGIALDCEENIYVGNQKQVTVYNSGLAPTGTVIPVADTVYDVKLSPSNILYTCGNGYISKDSVPLPKMVTVVSPSTSCGCTGTATATVCDNYPYTYSWSNGQTGQTATGLCPGKYIVTIKDVACIPRIDTASVTVKGGSGTFSVTSAATNLKCYGDKNGTATVNPTGTPPYTYKWSNGTTTQSDTGLAAGTYYCIVTESGGCSDSVVVTLTQPNPLTLSATTSPATCNTTCNGQAIVFPTGGTAGYSYAWSNGATNANINNMCVGTSYTCIVTDAHGCQHDTTLLIANPPPIVVTITSTPEQCSKLNGSATVSASGGTPGYTYSWNTGATTTTINNIASDYYCVVITDANKCVDTACVNVGYLPGDSVKIVSTTNELCYGGNNGSASAAIVSGASPYTYSWAPSGGTTLTASNLTAGLYTITVTDSNGCKNWAVANITQPTPVTVTAPPDTICIGQSATLTATATGGTPGYTYMWNGATPGATYTVSPTTSTNYVVQATDSNGCQSPNTPVTVVVRNPLIVVAGPPAKMCPGGSVTLSATGAGGDGVYTYTWSPATGLNATTGGSVVASPTTSITYTVVLTDACGTPQAQDTVPVIIYPQPTVNLKADTLQGCYPLCVKFSDQSTVTSGNITGWLWNFGDGDTSSSQNPTHCYPNPGVYTVSLSVVSNNGCKSSATINNYITVFDHPHASFSLSPQPTTILNPTIYFTDHSTDTYPIVNWLWSFGDGTDSTGVVKDPQHTYKDTGRYCVELWVTNIHGCKDSTIQCLEISPYFVIYVPNAFTPNNNGLNDVFTAKGVGILDFQMWIFDRWGQQLYHTYDINNGWDGKVQHGSSGSVAQEDTYVWLIQVTDVFHKDHRYIGKVTLIK